MIPMYSNATVMWTEREIAERDALVPVIYQTILEAWTSLNPAVRFCRVETPILTPANMLSGHVAEGFPMLDTKCGVLRPETTAGCIAAFHALFPNESQRRKRLPFCVWQVGKSFRNEANSESMRASRLRLREFYQAEFQLFTSQGTQADYVGASLAALAARFGGIKVVPDDLPHYSASTTDWEIDGVEVAGCSVRNDWPEGVLFEVSVGLDRLLRLITKERKDGQ